MFFERYPELQANDLIFTGESYAGKYLPLFSKAVLEFNEVTDDKINLKSTLILDAFTAPFYHWSAAHILPYALGIINDNNLR